jgi:hypothetical protein
MGLDITWYRGLSKAAENEGRDASGYPLDGFASFYRNPDFPGRADDISDEAVYRYEEVDGFRAGSYGGYNDWREELAKLAGYLPVSHSRFGSVEMRHDAAVWRAEGGPFFELIHFSDCEGVIGAAVSAKLAADFAEHQPKADAHPDDYFRERYAKWRRAFEKAADRGCVNFH